MKTATYTFEGGNTLAAHFVKREQLSFKDCVRKGLIQWSCCIP